MILGLGLDVVEISRVQQTLEKFGPRFLKRVFTEAERAYCDAKPQPVLHYAARFAAKEAAVKALGTGLSQGISWQHISIENLASGQPVLRLSGAAQEIAARLGVKSSHVSLSHSHTVAAAVVALENSDAVTPQP
jgi:holo-[acyl-carrier protein] synthase